MARAPGTPGPAGATAVASPATAESPKPAGVEEAFRRALTDSSAQLKSTPTEDWYVGIGGVPVGPVRLSVLREKAVAGAVHPESLVWREGFDEWVPLKKFPELLELVEAAQKHAQPRRPSSTGLAAVKVPEPAPAAKADDFDDPPTEVVGAAGLAALGARGDKAPPTPPAAGAAPVAMVGAPTVGAPTVGAPTVGAPMVGAPTVQPSREAPPSAPSAKAAPASSAPSSEAPAERDEKKAEKAAPLGLMGDPFAAPAPATPLEASAAATAASVPQSVHEPLPAGVPQKRGVHPMAWAFVAAAAVFGGVAAYFTFAKKPEAETKIVYLPSSTEATGAAPRGGPDLPPPPAADTASAAAPEASAAASASAKVASAGGTGKPGSAPSASASATSGNFDNSGLAGGPGVVGPSATATGTAGGSSGGQLTQGEIQGVVSSRQALVRRKCWQPALDARTNPSATTARVTANIVIGPSGNVQSASVGGSEKDFPGLSSCIAADIKGWKFPASGGTTPVTVPFVFAAQ